MADPSLLLSGVARTFRSGDGELRVLAGADLTIDPGQTVALVAPSGTGKSTLLHVAGLLDTPDGGEVSVMGRPASRLGDAGRTALRRSAIGFVYQFHHLLPEFTAAENVALPMLAAGIGAHKARDRASALLGELGLGGKEGRRPGQLSGGEQQRVAVARAMANGPGVLLADEPTGNLDEATGVALMEALLRTCRETGMAALIATHNPALAARLDRRVTLREGRIVPA